MSGQEHAITKIEIIPLAGDCLTSGKVRIKSHCNFCEKETALYKNRKSQYDKLSGAGQFYCAFCLRHGLNNKSNVNVLILNFRGIIGYYYHAFYRSTDSKMSISEIQDYVALHEKIGLKNPVFSYDADSFNWFVDFNKVGRKVKKVRLEYVLSTIVEILACFNVYQHIDNVIAHKLYEKYEEAITEFHQNRNRPVERKILSPTLIKCGVAAMPQDIICKNLTLESTRNFLPSDIQIVEKFKKY